ncbi:MAG TPA: hypothetical protein VI279_16250 [Rhodocyclaceae bacterium]
MLARFYLILGLASVAMVGYADYRGYGLFDNIADSRPTRSSAHGSGNYHK